MTLFSNLPLYDIVHEILMPMLDYESRIQFNQFLEPEDRYRSRFSKHDRIRHTLYVLAKDVRSRFQRLEDAPRSEQTVRRRKRTQIIVEILTMFQPGKRWRLLLEHLPGFHRTFVEKLTSFLDPTSGNLDLASDYFRRKIRKLCESILPTVETLSPTKFPGAITPISMSNYTPVPIF